MERFPEKKSGCQPETVFTDWDLLDSNYSEAKREDNESRQYKMISKCILCLAETREILALIIKIYVTIKIMKILETGNKK